MTSFSTSLRIAAVAGVVFAFTGSAAGACRDFTDCTSPPPGGRTIYQSPSGCYVPMCTRPNTTVCNTAANQPVDPTCVCSYGTAPDAGPCGLNPGLACGVCVTGQCVSSDTDSDGSCFENDSCPALAHSDQSDVDGDGAGDVCDDWDVLLRVKKFNVGASSRDLTSGGLRANGKVQVKGDFTRDLRWSNSLTEVAVIVTADHPTKPFDQRWKLPCAIRGSFLYCETTSTNRNDPYIRAKFRWNGAIVSVDVNAKNLTLPAAPTMVAPPGVTDDTWRPALAVVTSRNTAFPLTSYLTAPSPITGVDRKLDRIGRAQEGWSCRESTTKLSCSKR